MKNTLKNSKISSHSRFSCGMLLFLLMANFAHAKGFKETIDTIVDYLDNVIIKSVGTLIIIAIGIYMLANHDKWREIFKTCLAIILAVLVVCNAKNISNMFF